MIEEAKNRATRRTRYKLQRCARFRIRNPNHACFIAPRSDSKWAQVLYGGIRFQPKSQVSSSCIRMASDMQSRTCKLHICHSRPARGSLRHLGFELKRKKYHPSATCPSSPRFAPAPNVPLEPQALDSFNWLALDGRCCSLSVCILFGCQFLSKSASHHLIRRW